MQQAPSAAHAQVFAGGAELVQDGVELGRLRPGALRVEFLGPSRSASCGHLFSIETIRDF